MTTNNYTDNDDHEGEKYSAIVTDNNVIMMLRLLITTTLMTAGDMIDCTRMGVGGKAIPPYIDKITDIR